MKGELFMMRLNITVSDEVNEKLNGIAGKWGVSKSNLCAMVLGQYVDGLDKAYEMLDKYGEGIIKKVGVTLE